MRPVFPLAGALLICVLATAGCGQSSPPPEQPTESAPHRPPVDGPHMTFETMVHDFGRITDTRKQTALFSFTNTGTETLIVQDLTPSCGCTVASLKRREFPPGDGDVISVTFEPKGRPGQTDKTVDVVSNSRPDPVAKLRIKAFVESMLRCDRFLWFGKVKLGQEHKEVIRVQYDDPDMVIRHAVVNQPYVSARITEMGHPVPGPRGKTAYEGTIEVTLSADAPWGVIQGTRVRLVSYGRPDVESDPVDFNYDVYLRGEIWGDLQTKSNLLSVGQISPTDTFEETAILSRQSGEPFTVTDARITECEMPQVEVRAEPVSPSEYRVVIHGSPGRYRGNFRCVATLTTDVPGEEAITFHFSGRVKEPDLGRGAGKSE